MKKFMIGLVSGALLMASGQVLADSVSKIGQKIDGEAKVVLNGEQLSNAVISEGKSYAPVRDIAEALGASASYTKGVITIEENQADIGIPDKIALLEGKKKIIEDKIASVEKSIKGLEEETIPFREERLKTAVTDAQKAGSQAVIDELKLALSEHKTNLADLNAQLRVIDAEIESLNSQI